MCAEHCGRGIGYINKSLMNIRLKNAASLDDRSAPGHFDSGCELNGLGKSTDCPTSPAERHRLESEEDGLQRVSERAGGELEAIDGGTLGKLVDEVGRAGRPRRQGRRARVGRATKEGQGAIEMAVGRF